MKPGIFLIYLAFAATLFSAFNYYRLAVLEKTNAKATLLKSKKDVARMGFYIMSAFVALASLYLWYLIFTHQFQVDYIYRYTSRDLGIGYLFSAFWAGQEGSFLFWALMIAVGGLIFIPTAGKLESYSMFVINMVQLAFLILLVKASPFALQNTIPADGAGLNPLLQNPWMVIHPPILFLGYAATTLPFAVGIAALLKKDFQDWVKLVLPWTLFASITMGAGIIIGAYWAYKVLGWGGYWGWDPVENSSLIAWLTVLALFHGLIITRIRGGMQKTSFILTTLSFVSVLYATFLTRSGVLADFSVHSFQDLGINAYLTIYIILALLSGLILVLKERKSIPYVKINFSIITKEQILVFTLQIILLSAFLILIGTSSPLITQLFGEPAQVDMSFYDSVNLPVAVIMCLLLGIAPLLSWNKESIKELLMRLIPSIIVAVLAAVISVLSDITKVLQVIFMASVMFAFTSNFIAVIQKLKNGWRLVVAPLTHIGVALIFAGVIVSGQLATSDRITLTQGVSGQALGYDLTYSKDFTSPDGKNGLSIDIKDGDDLYVADPRLYMNNYSRSVMSEPYLNESLFSDLYLSLLQKIDGSDAQSGNRMIINKGEHKDIAGYHITFSEFEMGQHQETQEFRVAAVLNVNANGSEYVLKPAIAMAAEGRQDLPAEIPSGMHGGNQISISIANINAEDKQVELIFNGLENTTNSASVPQVVVEVSKKPFMGVLWIGTIILTLGTILAMKKRSEEQKIVIKTVEKEEKTKTCKKCKTPNKLDAKFCKECGKSLKDAA